MTAREVVLARLKASPYEAALRLAELDRVLAEGMEGDDPRERACSFLLRLSLQFPHYRIGRDE
jgi:hypothetical protein